MHDGLQHCLGKTKTPSVQQKKSAVVKRATEHTVGETHHVGQSTTAVLSPEQFTRGRELRMSELIGDEPALDRRTVGWYHSCATSCVFSDNKIWLDISWLALLSAEYKVNIMVWEPSGKNETVQPRSSSNIKGSFLYDKKEIIDEPGEYWLHLLFRLEANPWAGPCRCGGGEEGTSDTQPFRLAAAWARGF
ncbi:unnamed protein product [Pylaiella littoralis]